jgi:hypothetical protein
MPFISVSQELEVDLDLKIEELIYFFVHQVLRLI